MTIIFKSLPDQLFSSLCDFVLTHSSEEHQFTICIESKLVSRHSAGHYCSDAVSAEHMVWLQQHINVEELFRNNITPNI
jgi:hypothetical protein